MNPALRIAAEPAVHRAGSGLLLALLSLCSPAVQADARTDGTAGRVQALSGQFTVPQSLGTLAGANLFHSFQNFSVNPGESATFTTSTALQNVVARVTGGLPSTINGPLRLDAAGGGKPSLFLINPSGITLGAGGSVDVPGALHLSTANYLKFSDGSVYQTDLAKGSTFSAAAPQAFGFLGPSAAAIVLQDKAELTFLGGQSLSITAGDITIKDTTVLTAGGKVFLAAVGAWTGELGSPSQQPLLSGKLVVENGALVAAFSRTLADTSEVAVAAGDIVIGSTTSIAGAGIASVATAAGAGGSVRIDASNSLSLLNGGVLGSSTDGTGAAGNVQVSVGGKLLIGSRSSIDSATTASGNAGAVKVAVLGAIVLDGGGSADGAGIGSETGASGASGGVTVSAGAGLSLLNGGRISSSTFGSGPAGLVKVDAASILLEGRGAPGGSGIISESRGTGDAGSVNVAAQEAVTIAAGARISSSSFAAGNAGGVTLRSASLTLEGAAGGAFPDASPGTIISVAAQTGNAGTVRIDLRDQLSISGGLISTTTLGGGKGGSISISAGSVSINDTGSNGGAGVTSNAGGAGAAGNIDITASGALEVRHGATISSSTYGAGSAGAVNVAAGRIQLDGQGSAYDTSIVSETYGSGSAGSVDILTPGNLSIINQASISSSAFASGNGGQVRVRAGSIAIDGMDAARRTGIGSVAFSGTGSGGAVEVAASGLVSMLNGGEITSNTSTAGSAGSVKVTAETISLAGGASINSGATAGSSGQAGSVFVAAAHSVTLSDSRLSIENKATIERPGAVLQSQLSVSAPRIELVNSEITASAAGNIAAGNIEVLASTLLSARERSGINTSAVSGKGGSVVFRGGGALLLDHSRLTTSITGTANGDGGPITIDAPLIVLNAGFVQANTAVNNARGGDVNINVAAPGLLIASGQQLISGGQPQAYNPVAQGPNVIQAARPDGVNGELRIASPRIDLSTTLATLQTPQLDFGALGADLCRLGEGSSLTPLGRGALRPSYSEPVRPSLQP